MADAVVDTNVVSYIFRGDSRADLYRHYLDGKRVAISFMTIAELRGWSLVRDWGPRRQTNLNHYLDRFTVFYADRALCHTWAEITAEGERTGRPITAADAWIAAPAVHEGIPLVTHNRRHFERISGIEVVSLGAS